MSQAAGIALVTGAGRGIGAATALLLGRQGYDVCVNYRRDESSANEVVSALNAMGVKAIAVQADLADESEVEALFRSADEELGTLTALVNNAAVISPQARLETFSAARINAVLTTNVTGSILCCREAVRRMSTAHGGKGGSIVNLSSVAARLGSPEEYIDYAASKGAIDSLTVGLSKEVAGEGIRVNAVRPGPIYTEMHAAGGEPGRVERVAPAVPMGRGGQPEEVAATVAWLLSDEASYITGSIVDVSGGR